MLSGLVGALWTLVPAVIAAESPREAAPRIVAVDASIRQEGPVTTLSFVVSAPVNAKSTHLENPDRIVLDFPEINFQFDPGRAQAGRGLIRSYRYGLFAKGRSRIVIDLAEPAEVKSISVMPARQADAHLVTVIIARTDRESFRRSIATVLPPDPEPEESAPPKRDATKRTIVIDPGHGGVDPGAIGKNGLTEKDLVFDFAKRLRDKLMASGAYRVILTREEDVFVSLADRVRIARKYEADLFISLHADTLPRFDQVKGATIYTSAARASDAKAARVAEKENKSDMAAGLPDEQERGDEVSDILSDLAKRETRALSRLAAARLSAGITGVMTFNKNPLRAAGFKVLSAPDVPSLLLELGYLSSAADVANFTSEAWKDKAAAAVTAGIESYFAKRFAEGAHGLGR